MAPTVNGKVIFNEIPEGYPEPGKTLVYDENEKVDVQTIPLYGGVLLKTLCVSVDPYLRSRMRDPSVPSYMTAFDLGKPIVSDAVVVVVRSENPNVKPGEHYAAILPHQNYSIVKDVSGFEKLENKHNLPWSWFVGILGMPGRTAFCAWSEFSRAKAGETVYISTGGGPVGSLVIQLAKAAGLKVIASAGSDEKVEFMKQCRADIAFNYKKQDVKEVLKKEGPIQIYWDNVGGYQLEAALEAASIGARFIECGMIETYNTKNPYHVKNLFEITSKGLHVYGFIVMRDLTHWEEEFQRVMVNKVAKGELIMKEDVYKGLDKVGEVILAVQKGTNKGKAVVIVADE